MTSPKILCKEYSGFCIKYAVYLQLLSKRFMSNKETHTLPVLPSKRIEKQWFVLYTKPRNEKKLAERLQQNGIECYCPVRTEVRQWSDRKKKIKVPILPSMILVYIEDNKRSEVFNDSAAIRFLYELGKPAVVRDVEVESLKASLQKNIAKHEVERLQPGQRIDMESLGFAKVKGTVQYVKENACWVVLDGVGYVVKMQLSE